MAKDSKKGKKEKVKKEGKKLSALYETSGDSIKRKNRTCPKCGPGMFMGRHKDREVCGQCKYTEYNRKEEKKEDNKEENKEEKENKKRE